MFRNYLSASIRFLAFYLLYPFVRHSGYDHYVVGDPGYTAWYTIGDWCVAFETEDGSLQFRW